MSAEPLFSVIIPLECHRGQWQRCLQGWQKQALPQSQYEVIVVVPPGFSDESIESLKTMLWPEARIKHSSESHDINLAAVGATVARGRFLFFTESHCWPEPDVLEICLRRLAAERDLAGFSCRSIRVTHNRLSEAEAEMYDADINLYRSSHPWLKILDQCFVTRRECYDQSGGFDPDFGHFSEWLLSASYAALHYKLGYEPSARFHHFYIGEIGELESFTRDFAAGEMRFHSTRQDRSYGHLLAAPEEWWRQGSWNSELARSLLRVVSHSARNGGLPTGATRALVRWTVPACVGARGSLWFAEGRRLLAKTWLQLMTTVGTRAALAASFKTYVAALIYEERLKALSDQAAVTWNVFNPGNAGFYASEVRNGVRFRWSETAAMLPASLSAGSHRVRIECLPVRHLTAEWAPRFYLNERPIPEADVSTEGETIELRLRLPSAGSARLAWTCSKFPALDDRRILGLPVKAVSCSSG